MLGGVCVKCKALHDWLHVAGYSFGAGCAGYINQQGGSQYKELE